MENIKFYLWRIFYEKTDVRIMFWYNDEWQTYWVKNKGLEVKVPNFQLWICLLHRYLNITCYIKTKCRICFSFNSLGLLGSSSPLKSPSIYPQTQDRTIDVILNLISIISQVKLVIVGCAQNISLICSPVSFQHKNIGSRTQNF